MLNLNPIQAFTVNSPDDEYRSSDKGIYRTKEIAQSKCKNAGWYGSAGKVEEKDDIYIDENGTLYEVTKLGGFTDEDIRKKNDLIESIKSKLTQEELALLNFKP